MNGEIINFLNKFTKSGTPVKDLSRFSVLMDSLGNPQDNLRFVHIAGTNGKGSTARMIASALTESGYKVGEFTSPYVFTYNDRIKINGVMISDSDLEDIFKIIRPAAFKHGDGCSQFEISTAAAFIYFLREKCDIVVLETGLGGLNDCTNIIRDNVCSVITSIALDHTAVLGDTIAEIAEQKAGIIKDGCPVVLSPFNPPEAVKIVSRKAALSGSKLVIPDERSIRVMTADYKGNTFSYKLLEYCTTMPGLHQITNAVTAIEACRIIRKYYPSLVDKNVFEGVNSAVMPSRCQIVREKDPMILVDGAHNPDGMRVLSEFVSTLTNYPKVMICGMSADKDWKTALSYIAPMIDKAFCVDGFTPNTVFSPKLCTAFRNAQSASLSNVYSLAKTAAGKNGLLIIGGSLYLPGAINRFAK